MNYYIAYGSNLYSEQFQHRCPDAVFVASGVLKHYTLAFCGSNGNAFLTVKRQADGSVPVAVYRISSSDERSLDRYEGYPNFYIKEQAVVELNTDVKIKGMMYIMKEQPYAYPSESYFSVCSMGYQQLGFPVEILENARAYLETSSAVGHNLQFYRKRVEYSQSELEILCGFCKGKICKLETGERDFRRVSADVYILLKRYLRFDDSYIFLKKPRS